MNIVSLSGSPSKTSRSAWLLQLALSRLPAGAQPVRAVRVRELSAEALLEGDLAHPQLRLAIDAVVQADLLLVATPIYQAAYSGLLKAFLDLLPPDALRGTTVLPLATGGSAGHLLALDDALKPVLAALGARHILDAVYALDEQLVPHEPMGFAVDEELVERIDRVLSGPFGEIVANTFVPQAAQS